MSTPEPFLAVGRFHENFDQTTDTDVVELLWQVHAGLESAPVAFGR